MKLILSEEQEFLRDTAKSFVNEKTPISHFRSLRDNNHINLWDEDVWNEMVKLGWSGILIPEEYGGSNFGVAGISVILQECGKNLTPSPLLGTAVLGAYAISTFGSDEQKKKYLPQIVSGKITTSIAIDESTHHNPSDTNLQANYKNDKKFLLNGKKLMVMDGASSDVTIILARTSGNKGDITGLSLFIVETDNPNIKINKLNMADSRNYANIECHDLEVTEKNLLGDLESGGDIINKILDIGRICLSAEMLGNTESAFEKTLDYLKERKQFGVPIGSFQALQHRAAEMFCEIELTKSAVIAALKAADSNSNDIERMASLAKSMVGATLHLVSNESIQMHGGIGVTDEYDIGFFLKRARVAEQLFGSTNYHKERYALISGF